MSQSGTIKIDTSIAPHCFGTYPTPPLQVCANPKLSDWECWLVGEPGKPWGTKLIPTQGTEPCWFHRKMQELCFGFKWRKRTP